MMTASNFRLLVVCLLAFWSHAWILPQQEQRHRRLAKTATTTTHLQMGLLDSFSDFLQGRDDDFEKLDKADDSEYGPGPIMLLSNIPSSIENDEILDMLADGAPKAHKKGIQLCRLDSSTADVFLDQSLRQALDSVALLSSKKVDNTSSPSQNPFFGTDAGILAKCPVLFFSGFSNTEMMAAYGIIGQEIFQEMAGQATPACAKAVPAAMNKPLRQVLEEVSGDHLDATEKDTLRHNSNKED
jgi:hypothetical protein